MAGKNNRNLGNAWETEVIRTLAKHFDLIPFAPKTQGVQLGSSRQFSKITDDEGVDIVFTRHAPSWIKRFLFQCKRTVIASKSTTPININGLYNIKPEQGEVPILVTNVYKKQGKRNVRREPVVTMYMDDFLKMMEYVRRADHAGEDQRVSE